MDERTIAIVVFLVTYVAIVSERLHKTTAALAGGMLLVALHVLDTEQAFEAIDLEVIFLLAGMMVIANTLSSTGVFQWLAIRSAKMAKGDPVGVLVILCAITAVASAFLDNVTTVVLIAPVALVVADTLEVRPEPGLIALALASNIGGTATLIGDPPNILIASHADIDFLHFLINVGPVAVLTLGVFLAVLPLIAGRAVQGNAQLRQRVMEMDDSALITDPRLLRTSLLVLAVTILAFTFQAPLGYEPASIALMGAALLLLITRNDPHGPLRDVEWSTLFFFIGLFIVIAGLEHEGVLEDLGQRATDLTEGSRIGATFLILWMSGLASGIVDNIPYTATMLPIVSELADNTEGDTDVFWWALAIGADMGGNLTIIAASANVLVANLAARNGTPISFWMFLRYGALATLLSMTIATAYLWLRYFAF